MGHMLSMPVPRRASSGELDTDMAEGNKGSGDWQGSHISVDNITGLHVRRLLSTEACVGMRLTTADEVVPTALPGESVVFMDHFDRGLMLPTSPFMSRG